MTTTSDSMKELHALAQRVAAASRDHSLLPEIRDKCQRSLADVDPESVGRTTADYRAGQAEILLAVLTALEQRTQPNYEGQEHGLSRKTPQKTNEPKQQFRISLAWWMLIIFLVVMCLYNQFLHK